MPGPASHLTILDLQTQRLVASGARQHPVTRALSAAPQHGALGSIGPDMIFWADWGEYTPIIQVIYDVYHTIDEVVEELNALWKPIGDAIDKVQASLTGGLTTQIERTVRLARATMEAAMLDLITTQIDLLSLLKPEMQKSGVRNSEVDWNWLDFLHHRRTGAMAKALIRRAHASRDPGLLAYAYGWLSHVTADTVGHPYVNVAVGGPYRSHWQRHFIQEKFMDVWVYGFYNTPGVAMPVAVFPNQIPFDYAAFANVNGAGLHQRIDLGSDLPSDLQRLIAAALRDTYLRDPHPNVKGTIPFLGESDINRAYQMTVDAFELISGKDRVIARPRPPSVFNDDAPPSWPSRGGSGGTGGGSSGGFSLLKLLESILEFLRDLLEYAHDLALWLVSQVTTPLTYPVRYALYLVQLALYEAYRTFRWGLALSGYAYCDPDQLPHPLVQQFINPFAPPAEVLLGRPRREYPDEQDNCLSFPASALEPRAVLAGPYTRHPLNYPYWFIEGEPSDEAFERTLARAKSPAETEQLLLTRFNPNPLVHGAPGSLGSAVDFYVRRAAEIEADGGGPNRLLLPDWNLDGDRGYGSKCWRLDPTNADNDLEPPRAGGVQAIHAAPD